MMKYDISSEVGKIEAILLKHPREAFVSQANVDTQWKELNYFGPPDFNRALSEYQSFLNILKGEHIDINFLSHRDSTGIDSVYIRDTVIITPKGAILCNMGKKAREAEPHAVGEYLKKQDVPILGTVTGEGRLEGGDIIWLDAETVAVGQGYRSNAAGIGQLKELTANFVRNLVVIPLPHWEGPDDVFHLMSIISPIDHDLAVVYSRLMPVPFRECLIGRGVKLIDVPDDEFASMGCNILALAPRRCLMLTGNPRTKKLLEESGTEVLEYEGEEISKKGAGGPTCLTRPLVRLQ
jgi:N-dimethylarginine dimethylaminohydrolase